MGNFVTNLYGLFNTQLTIGNLSPVMLLIAFLGGILTSITPCTIGILPIIISYVASSKEKASLKIVLQLVAFIFGMAFAMSIVGILSVMLGRVFVSFGGAYLTIFIASLFMVLGLNLLGLLELQYPAFIQKMPDVNEANRFIYPFLIGIIYAISATPCSTPILASILGFASLSQNFSFACILLFVFTLGQGVIILAIGLCTSLIKNLRSLAPFSNLMSKFAGVILIFCALFMYFRIFSPFMK